MHHAFVLVQVFQSFRHLRDDVSTEILAEVGQADDLMEELAARAELQDNVVVLSGFGEVDKFDDIRVVELSHDLYLFEDVRSLFEKIRLISCDNRNTTLGKEAMTSEGQTHSQDHNAVIYGIYAHLHNLRLLLKIRM